MRTLGITIIGGLFVILGGFSSLVVLFKVIDSLSAGGVHSIIVHNLRSFHGFTVFAIMPLFIYSLGMGILLRRSWARKAVIRIFPILVLVFMITESNFLFWLATILFLIYYFTRAEVKSQFM